MRRSGKHSSAEMVTESAFRALVRSYGLLNRVSQPYFARFGISPSQWGVLRALQCSEVEGLAALRVTDLGGRLLVRPPSVTAVVDRLQRMGWVCRNPSAEDRRSKRVSLTPAGRNLVQRILAHHSEHIESLLADLDQQERRQLQELLERLCLRMEQLAAREESFRVPQGLSAGR